MNTGNTIRRQTQRNEREDNKVVMRYDVVHHNQNLYKIG